MLWNTTSHNLCKSFKSGLACMIWVHGAYITLPWTDNSVKNFKWSQSSEVWCKHSSPFVSLFLLTYFLLLYCLTPKESTVHHQIPPPLPDPWHNHMKIYMEDKHKNCIFLWPAYLEIHRPRNVCTTLFSQFLLQNLLSNCRIWWQSFCHN